MVCRLLRAKPLPEPIMILCRSEPVEYISIRFSFIFNHFQSKKCIWKCCLKNLRYFVSVNALKYNVTCYGYHHTVMYLLSPSFHCPKIKSHDMRMTRHWFMTVLFISTKKLEHKTKWQLQILGCGKYITFQTIVFCDITWFERNALHDCLFHLMVKKWWENANISYILSKQISR